MEPQDDPEARIRDLERPLSEVARTSELGIGAPDGTHGYVPPAAEAYPPPPPTTPWDAQYSPMPPPSNAASSRGYVIPVVIAVLAILAAGGVSAYLFLTGGPSDPGVAGGGATLSDSPAERPSTGAGWTLLPTQGATEPAAPPVGPEPPPGTAVTVAGIGEDETIACDGRILIISGVENTVTVSGHCASMAVSGVNNEVTVDSVDNIVVSGFDNRVVFHVGEPEVTNSGSGNTIDRG